VINSNDGGTTAFSGDATADNATINSNKGGATSFADNSKAGNAKINTDGGATSFSGNSSADNATIDTKNGGATSFDGSANAGSATINTDQDGKTSFSGKSDAGSAVINSNDGGATSFSGDANADNATINSNKGGSTSFADNAKAGKAKITTDGGATSFSGNSSADNATIDTKNGGTTSFADNTTAGNAQIHSSDGGATNFSGSANAGNAAISADKGGSANFSGNSSAGSASIAANDGGTASFTDNATADKAKITTNSGGKTAFSGNSTAGSAELVINQGGTASFSGKASGGDADVVMGGGGQPGGALDISGLDTDGTGIASLNGSGAVNLGGKTLDIGGSGKDSAFGGKISGTGGIAKNGGGTMTLAGDNDYSGQTQVNGGIFNLAGKAKNSEIVVNTDAILQGGGEMGGLHVKNGGTLSPGAGFRGRGGAAPKAETMTVDGNAIFDQGSRFEVKEDKTGRNDSLAVKGDAIIHGGQVATQGLIHPGQSFDNILTASGKISGGFDGIDAEFKTAYMGPVFIQTEHGISMKIARIGASFNDIGTNPNAAKLGGGVESLPDSNILKLQMLNSTREQTAQALTQLSPEIYASARTAMFQSAEYMRSAMNDRMDRYSAAGFLTAGKAGQGGKAQAAFAAPARLDAIMTGSIPESGRLPFGAGKLGAGEVWARGFTSQQDNTGARNGAHGHNITTTGTFAGLDTKAGRWLLGAATGYSYADFNNKYLPSYGHINTIYSGLYAAAEFKRVSLRFGGQQSWHTLRARREVAFTRFADSLKSKSHARQTQLYAEAGLPFNFTPGGKITARLEPFGAVAFNYLRSGKVREKGGAAAVSGGKGGENYLASTFGLRGQTALYATQDRAAVLRGMLGWQHIYGANVPAANYAFAGGEGFDVQGTPLERDSLALETGIDFRFTSKAAFGISYNGRYGKRNSDYGMRADFRLKY